jgi:hypothetical protein
MSEVHHNFWNVRWSRSRPRCIHRILCYVRGTYTAGVHRWRICCPAVKNCTGYGSWCTSLFDRYKSKRFHARASITNFHSLVCLLVHQCQMQNNCNNMLEGTFRIGWYRLVNSLSLPLMDPCWVKNNYRKKWIWLSEDSINGYFAFLHNQSQIEVDLIGSPLQLTLSREQGVVAVNLSSHLIPTAPCGLFPPLPNFLLWHTVMGLAGLE